MRRPYHAPFYPLLPLAFVLGSVYVLYSSLAHVKVGAITGVVVMLVGVLLLLPMRFVAHRRKADSGARIASH